ncbi:hypothetical protein EW146_g8737 [Bondarzewia mesenterica]|uniref:Uncharacterized protein n=1 Tax=Bondarzewia mesenterica TaxID=1095465 RepID=A0A4S4LCE5_9AGAM|nr:hypothetical protein EW146_g8737 [Bondarzewia mesenterica]
MTSRSSPFGQRYSWLPDVFRIKNSIIGRVFGPVLTVTIFAVAVAYAASKGRNVTLTNSVTPLLAVVVGLILVFRNGTSYDRYYEGRKSFGAITSHVRNLSRLIWINVALPPTDEAPPRTKGKTPKTTVTASQLRRRKADALKLCLAFAYAVKHYLREEDGLDWDDYIDVVPASFFKEHDIGPDAARSRKNSATVSYNAVSDAMSSLDNSRTASPDAGVNSDGSGHTPTATKRVRVKRSLDKLHGAKTPLLTSDHRAINFNPYTEATIPLPLVSVWSSRCLTFAAHSCFAPPPPPRLSYEIARLLFGFRRDGFLETVGPAGTNAMNLLVQGMVDQMTNMERIANTPIPKSYSIHLKQCVSMYLFALPFTLIKELGWAMIPVVTVVAFTFMGIEGIADEIEMPFGLDDADLPLGSYLLYRYCSDLKEEINYMIDRLPEGGQGGYGYDDGEGDD